MKTWPWLWLGRGVVCLALSAWVTCAGAAPNVLVNGGFEALPFGNPPVGWELLIGGGGTVAPSSLVSPFAAPDGPSAQSAHLQDPGNSGPILEQTLPALQANFLMSYDFRLGGQTLNGHAWHVVGNSANVGGQISTLFNLFLDDQGQFAVIDGSTFLRHAVMTLELNTWYHVEILASLQTATYSGTITAFGGATAGWNNLELQHVAPQFLNLGGIQFRDGSSVEANSDLYVDNVYLAPVPEPSVWGLASVAGLALLWRARGRRHGAASYWNS